MMKLRVVLESRLARKSSLLTLTTGCGCGAGGGGENWHVVRVRLMSPAHGQLICVPGRTGSKLDAYDEPTEKALVEALRIGPWTGTVRDDWVVAIWPRI